MRLYLIAFQHKLQTFQLYNIYKTPIATFLFNFYTKISYYLLNNDLYFQDEHSLFHKALYEVRQGRPFIDPISAYHKRQNPITGPYKQ